MDTRRRIVELMAKTWDVEIELIKSDILPMRDLGVDSLDMANFLMELEGELQVQMETDEDDYFGMTVEEIIQKAESRLAVAC